LKPGLGFRRAVNAQAVETLTAVNRQATIGRSRPNQHTAGTALRSVRQEYKGKLQSVIEDRDLPNPVIGSHYGHGFAKQYVRDDRLLRTEPATNNVYHYGVHKNVENLPPLRTRMSEIIDHYHNV
jgi:hypothetical protein